MGRQREDPVENPVVIAFDPGVTTGWSVIQVHPEALCSPQVSILRNILHWSHGEIVGEPVAVAADSALSKRQEEVNKYAGSGWTVDSSPESAAVHQMVELVKLWPGATVVVEDFIIRQFNQGRDFLAPVRITAALDYALWKMGLQALRQQPSEAKGAVTDVRLKNWGFYESKGGLDHARDADRHAITLLRKMKDPNNGPYRRHMCWPHIYDKTGQMS